MEPITQTGISRYSHATDTASNSADITVQAAGAAAGTSCDEPSTKRRISARLMLRAADHLSNDPLRDPRQRSPVPCPTMPVQTRIEVGDGVGCSQEGPAADTVSASGLEVHASSAESSDGRSIYQVAACSAVDCDTKHADLGELSRSCLSKTADDRLIDDYDHQPKDDDIACVRSYYHNGFTAINEADYQLDYSRYTSDEEKHGDYQHRAPPTLEISEQATNIPRGVSNRDVLAAAMRLNESSWPDRSTPTPKRHYTLGPRQKVTKVSEETASQVSDEVASSAPPPDVLQVSPAQSWPKSQRILSRYPCPSDPLPPECTLHQLCREYPNHLHGSNLLPFIQQGWTASQIFGLVQQSRVRNGSTLTRSIISQRLGRAKVKYRRTRVKQGKSRPSVEKPVTRIIMDHDT